MGNRAGITTPHEYRNDGIGVYLHWNGGRDSIEGFLTYCKLKGYRSPETDCYGWARLCQVVGNFFGGSTSVGIDKVANLDCDNHDNGVYFIKNWEIVARKFNYRSEQHKYSLKDMLTDINSSMPKGEQLPDETIEEYIKKET